MNVNFFEVELIISKIVHVVLTTRVNGKDPSFC